MRLLAATLLLAACTPEGALEAPDALDGFVAELAVEQASPPLRTPPRFGGCGDTAFWASNAADTVGLHVFAADLILQGRQSPTTTQTYAYGFTLPAADMALSFDVGTEVTFNDCNDVFINNVVTQTWEPVSGDAHVLINLVGPLAPWGEYPAIGTLTLTGLVVEETSTGQQRSLPDMVLSDVDVGWFPG